MGHVTPSCDKIDFMVSLNGLSITVIIVFQKNVFQSISSFAKTDYHFIFTCLIWQHISTVFIYIYCCIQFYVRVSSI